MTHTEEVTAGWLRATRHALGLSVDKMSMLIGVNANTIQHKWEHGTAPIPEGVRTDVVKLVEYTDAIAQHLTRTAEAINEPAIVVYSGRDDLPARHMALRYGRDWWDRVAFSVAQAVPDLLIGYPWEIAAAYDYSAGSIDAIYDHPAILAMYTNPEPADTLQ
jgi:hypothetical protein